jgi:hypothetical protein
MSNQGQYLEEAYKTVNGMSPPQYLGYSSSNNVYPTFPPLMSSGREIKTNLQPEAVTNNEIIKRENITSNWEYRKYLQANAVQIMKQDFIISKNQVM